MIKSFSLLILFIAPINAYSENSKVEFSQFPVPVQNIQCKELDFSSYHKVENVKTNMLRANPERKSPNFAGKYLLLKNEFLFDTAWFVADCSTGKFIKEQLSPDQKKPIISSRADSNLVIFNDSEYLVFQNEKWMKINPHTPPAPTSTPAGTPPSNSANSTCKELDFSSNSRAQNAKKSLIEGNSNRSQANFNGHYLLLKGETIFQTYWMIADCNTGKFYSEIITGNIEFSNNSSKVKIISSSEFPTYAIWLEEDQQWLNLQGSSRIYNKYAKALFESLPNPNKSSILRFENLNWKIDENEIKIKNGKCSYENKKHICDIDI